MGGPPSWQAFSAGGLSYDPACIVPYCANVCALVRVCGGVGIVDGTTARAFASQGLVWKPIDDIPDISIVAFHRRDEPLRAAAEELFKQLRSAG